MDNLLDALNSAQKRLERVDDQEMELSSKWLSLGLSEHLVRRQIAMLNKERESWQSEVDRLKTQLSQVEQNFVTVDQIRELTDRVGGNLADADFDKRRFALESLEAQITVTHDGDIRLAFFAPEIVPETLTDIVLPTPWRRTR